jgi:hypothetical protein
MRLPFIGRKKNLCKINMLVLRFLKTGDLASSKPCVNCIKNMMNEPVRKGYKIEDIYYSDYDGSIVKTSLKKLSVDDSVHVSGFYRNLNCKRWSN